MRDRPSGFANPWLQLALSVGCVFVSELLLKRGASDTANPAQGWSWTGVTGLASPLVWLGIIFVIISFISWLYVLRYIPLTIAFPLSRVVDILVPLGCWFFRRSNLYATLVRHRTGSHRSGRDSKTGRAAGGTVMTLLSLVLILLALLTFVGGQLILKRAMESTVVYGLRQSRFIALLGCGIFLMTLSVFLTFI